MSLRLIFTAFLVNAALVSALHAEKSASIQQPEEGSKSILSPAYRACFGADSPLDAESYGCLDTEYHRLQTIFTQEYRSTLSRQANDPARNSLRQDESRWWRIRFRSCDKDAAEFSGSTATVIHESCEINALAQRIFTLRHYGG